MQIIFAVIAWLVALIAVSDYFSAPKAPAKKAKAGGGKGQKKGSPSESLVSLSEKLSLFIARYEWWLVSGVVLLGILARALNFPNIPPGLNQDEASIAYESYAIGNYGVDRNGDFMSVYPIAWGTGQGPFYVYFALPFIRLLGLSVFSYRLPNLLLGIASLPAFYFLVRRINSRLTAFIALILMAASPWSIISARWALDANPMPFLFIIAACIMTLAIDKKRLWAHMLSSVIFALCMYCYGAAIVVVPLFLALSWLYLLYHKRITLRELFLSGGVFALTALPLAIFMGINALNLDKIILPFMTFSKFTVMRSSTIFIPFDGNFLGNILSNFVKYLGLLLRQPDDLLWNTLPGYGTTYMFASPFILVGVFLLVKQCKRIEEFKLSSLMLFYFIAASVLTVMIDMNVNRAGVLFPAAIYMAAIGIHGCIRRFAPTFSIITAVAAISFCSFLFSYNVTYPGQIGVQFFESFGEAITDAIESTDGKIYVSHTGLNGAYILTMFYDRPDPREFVETVEYYDPNAEFRQAKRYGRFEFGLPERIEPTAVYLFHNSEEKYFDSSVFEINRFKNYSVAHPKE